MALELVAHGSPVPDPQFQKVYEPFLRAPIPVQGEDLTIGAGSLVSRR